MPNNQKKGNITQKVFEQAANYYRNNGQLAWRRTHPEFVVRESADDEKSLVTGFFREPATADYCLSLIVHDDLKRTFGQAAWIEIKGVTVKKLGDSYTITERLHQYDQMAEDQHDGLAWGYYLVEWSSKTHDPSWTLYPVRDLQRDFDRIIFHYDLGLPVPSLGGWPEFYPVIIAHAAQRQSDISNKMTIRTEEVA